MDAVPKVTGTFDAFDGRTLSHRAIRRSVYGMWRFAWFGLIAAYFVLFGFFIWVIEKIGMKFTGDGWMLTVACILVPALCVDGLRRLINHLADNRWYARGVPRQVEVTYAIESEGLLVSSRASRSIIFWTSINEVVLDRNRWLLIGPGVGYFLARHLFSDASEERAFISRILAQLSPAAQARSSGAYKVLTSLTVS